MGLSGWGEGKWGRVYQIPLVWRFSSIFTIFRSHLIALTLSCFCRSCISRMLVNWSWYWVLLDRLDRLDGEEFWASGSPLVLIVECRFGTLIWYYESSVLKVEIVCQTRPVNCLVGEGLTLGSWGLEERHQRGDAVGIQLLQSFLLFFWPRRDILSWPLHTWTLIWVEN